MIGDAVPFHQLDEIVLGVALERRDTKARICGQVVRRCCVQIGEVGAAAAGNADLLRHFRSAFQHQHPPPAFVRLRRAHKTGRAGPDDDDVKILHGGAGAG